MGERFAADTVANTIENVITSQGLHLHKLTALNQGHEVREVNGNRLGGRRSCLHRQKAAAVTVMLELFRDFDCGLVADNFATILLDLAKGFFERIHWFDGRRW